jgi:hypothetical protein
MAIFLFMVRALEAQTEKLQTAIEKISSTKVATGASEQHCCALLERVAQVSFSLGKLFFWGFVMQVLPAQLMIFLF